MTQNLITSAFELVRDVEHGVLLLDTFHRLAAREVRLLAASSSPASYAFLLLLPHALQPLPTPSLSCQCLLSSHWSPSVWMAWERDGEPPALAVLSASSRPSGYQANI